jgi:hypothetical protein
MAEYRAYKADVDRRVAAGHLTAKEGFVLTAFRMQGIFLEARAGEAIREPTCQKCGKKVSIIGGTAQRFRCPCSPEVEQVVADRVRAATAKR